MKPGSFIRWLGPEQTVGPGRGRVAISPGDIREVVCCPFAAGLWLRNKEGTGFYGAVDPKACQPVKRDARGNWVPA